MKHFILRRRYFEEGTFSTLHRQDGSKVCCVVERPDLNNVPSKSCVVEGTYDLLPHRSPKFGDCYALESKTLGVTRFEKSLRTHVLIHKANVPSDLQGCLAPGIDFGYVNYFPLDGSSSSNKRTCQYGSSPLTLTAFEVSI